MEEAIKTARRGLLPAIGLFFLAPLIAEYLLGDLPIKMLPVVLVLAPMYGGGALLIRELARRARLGWPHIILLALAYGLIEEAYTTQSLFNPNYLKLNLHLLDHAYIPAMGIGAWWTIFVLNLHTAWSISTSIALVEAAVPDRATTPWLGRIGLAVTALLFALGLVVTTRYQLKQDPFVASHLQLLSSGAIAVGLIFVAFWPRRTAEARMEGAVPNPLLVAALALAAGSAILVVPAAAAIVFRTKDWGWAGFLSILAIDLCMIALVWLWSQRSGWDLRHKLALASGAALAYGWHAFVGHPVVGSGAVLVRIGNAIFLLAAIALIAFAARRTIAWVKNSAPVEAKVS
jgi:hypothetical protein